MLDCYAPLPWETVAAAPQVAGDYASAPACAVSAPAELGRTTPRVAVAAPAHTVAWLARTLRGSMFPTFDLMVRRAFALAFRINDGCRLDAAQSARLRAAAHALWDAGAPCPAGLPGRSF